MLAFSGSRSRVGQCCGPAMTKPGTPRRASQCQSGRPGVWGHLPKGSACASPPSWPCSERARGLASGQEAGVGEDGRSSRGHVAQDGMVPPSPTLKARTGQG